jgi:hypothetical protein
MFRCYGYEWKTGSFNLLFCRWGILPVQFTVRHATTCSGLEQRGDKTDGFKYLYRLGSEDLTDMGHVLLPTQPTPVCGYPR